jgi:RHS repeat-associated protein
VRDAVEQNGDRQGRIVMRYDYDMLGNQIHQASMEAGERWVLNDVTGKPIRAWDSRGHIFRTEYDALRRATMSFVALDPHHPNDEICVQATLYGDEATHAETRLNLRGKPLLQCDTAGLVVSADVNPETLELEAYDFKGNPLRTTRRLAREYKENIDWRQVDWSAVTGALSANQFQMANLLQPFASMLEEAFTASVTYDALNRPVTSTSPDNSVYRPTFNEANLLDKVEVKLRGQTVADFVINIDYNEKGQRKLIVYKNGARTEYEYDRLTFRLSEMKTTRPAGSNGLASQVFKGSTIIQNVQYTYDPAGNITRIEDRALKTVDHGGPVPPVCEYTYDAVYRLVEAKGREHIAQTALVTDPPHPPNCDRRDFHFAGMQAHPNDLQALRNYTEIYEYDQVGNFKSLHHSANSGTWKRTYGYEHDSLFNDGKKSNRLTKTELGNGISYTETYTYADSSGRDVHGCMTAINDMKMAWDFKDQLQRVSLGDCGVAYYVYDATGQRVRKVIEQNGVRQKERLYLGGYEIYREFNGNVANVKLERATLHVMDDKQRIALVETKSVENGNAINAPTPLQRYQLSNHLGSASLELNHLAQLISYEEYHPYGTTAFQAMDSAAEVSLKQYRYTGMERDEESGFSYHTARYYLPWLGEWLSADPISIKGGINLYSYCSNNPVIRTDLEGTDDWCGPTDGFFGLFSSECHIAPEVSGTLKAVGGGFETAAGATMVAVGGATCEIGVGCFLAGAGVAVTGHGLDTIQSGLRTAVKGEPVDTFTSEGLQHLGISRRNANLIDAAIGIFGSLGAGSATRSTGVAATETGGQVAPSITVALKPALGPGHNYVGVTTADGITTWSHLRAPLGTAMVEGIESADMTSRLARSLSVTVPVTAAKAEAAYSTSIQALSATEAGGSAGLGAYSMTANSCSTYTASVMNSAGIWTPRITSPLLNLASAALRSPSVSQAVSLSGAGVNAVSGILSLRAQSESSSSASSSRASVFSPFAIPGMPNPADYSSFEQFRAGVTGPYTDEAVLAQWNSVHIQQFQ